MKRIISIYIIVLYSCYVCLVIVLNLFPRTTYSVLEKRTLASFPKFSNQQLLNGEYFNNISIWYSDTEPYRNYFILQSMKFRKLIQYNFYEEEHISIHTSSCSSNDTQDIDLNNTKMENIQTSSVTSTKVQEYHNRDLNNENAKIANEGIIVVGSGSKTRALMAYGGGAKAGIGYAKIANKYKRILGDKVNVYCMVIPTAIEFYCPEKIKSITRSQARTINNVFSNLDNTVKAVDIYSELVKHTNEDIYLRTDHHWSPLGGYYAAKQFAKVAEVPFRTLDNYDKKIVHGYVGSMFAYSGDIAVKENPEDFVYYIPKDISYSTVYINYSIDKNYHVIDEAKPIKSSYFFHYRDGSGGAYCTFMGGDAKITQVRTSVDNKRKLIILKDSFGNTLPGYLFYSFEEIHVIDYRYYTKNIIEYVTKHNITDVLFANNVFTASGSVCKAYERFLVQKEDVKDIKQDISSVDESINN